MVEIKPIEMGETTRQWIEWFAKLKEESDKWIQGKLGMTTEQLGEPKR